MTRLAEQRIEGAFASDLAAARVRSLSRRMTAYGATLAALLALSAFGRWIGLTEDGEVEAWRYIVGIFIDVAMLVMHVWMVVRIRMMARQADGGAPGATLGPAAWWNALLRWALGPADLADGQTAAAMVRVYLTVVVAASAVFCYSSLALEPFGMYESAVEARGGPSWHQGAWLLLQLFLLHVVACLLVSLSVREGLVLLGLLVLVFAGTQVFPGPAPAGVRLVMILLSPILGLPGFLYSWWRHVRVRRVTGRQLVYDRFGQTVEQLSEISRELQEAGRLHDALLPTSWEDEHFRFEMAYRPMRALGGDYLRVHRLPEGGVLIAVIDVTGHGVPAALAVHRLHDELTRLLSVSDNPAVILAGLNTFITERFADQAMFATASVVKVSRAVPPASSSASASGWRVTWCGGGHPAVLMVPTAERGQSTEALVSRMPMLGVMEPSLFAAEAADSVGDTHANGSGAVLVGFTDGLTEARPQGAAAGVSMPGEAGVLDALRRYGGVGAARGLRDLAMQTARGSPADDILVFELQFKG